MNENTDFQLTDIIIQLAKVLLLIWFLPLHGYWTNK